MNGISDGELNFTSREEFEAWLNEQPRESGVFLLTRAVLRYLPQLAYDKAISKDPELLSQFIAILFRSVALAWTSLRIELAEDTLTRGATQIEESAGRLLLDGKQRSQSAVPLDISAALARVAAHKRSYSPKVVADIAFLSIKEGEKTAFPLERGAYLQRCLKELSEDAIPLDHFILSPQELAANALWSGKRRGRSAAKRLAALLPSRQSWKIWIDWYHRRLSGEEIDEEIEAQFALGPLFPSVSIAEQNADLARRIAELQEARDARKPPADEQWDFFISYSSKDEADAREIAGILEQAGYSTFAQFKDIAPGNNFVREMQKGLESSRRFVALLSPAYESSDHCQAEWAAAYNRDAGGVGRKILPLVVRKTNLNALASQIVYVDLVGLTGEARRQAILLALAPKPLPKPVENISAPFDFGWNAAHRVTVVAGPQNTPIFPFAGSDQDHHDRLDACRKTVQRLIADLAAQRFNARPDYRFALETYLEELPATPGSGNLLLADAEARILRGLFEEDANILARALAERLNRILEFHIALRPFYPGVGRFYDDVRSGALTAPLPRDAIAGFVAVVRDHTPDIFESAVSRGIDKVEEDFEPHPAPPAPPLESGVLAPRPDPIDAPDPEKAQAYSITSTINAVYRAFLKGKDMASAIKGWDEIAQKLGEHAGPVIEFLRNFTSG